MNYVEHQCNLHPKYKLFVFKVSSPCSICHKTALKFSFTTSSQISRAPEELWPQSSYIFPFIQLKYSHFRFSSVPEYEHKKTSAGLFEDFMVISVLENTTREEDRKWLIPHGAV